MIDVESGASPTEKGCRIKCGSPYSFCYLSML